MELAYKDADYHYYSKDNGYLVRQNNEKNVRAQKLQQYKQYCGDCTADKGNYLRSVFLQSACNVAGVVFVDFGPPGVHCLLEKTLLQPAVHAETSHRAEPPADCRDEGLYRYCQRQSRKGSYDYVVILVACSGVYGNLGKPDEHEIQTHNCPSEHNTQY